MKSRVSIPVVFVAAIAVWFGAHYFLKDRGRIAAERVIDEFIHSQLQWRKDRYEIRFTDQVSENGEWIFIVHPEAAFGGMVQGVSVRVFFDPDSQRVTRHARF
jgi:hypothetical protein